MARLFRVQRLSGGERYRAILCSPATKRTRLVEVFAQPNRLELARLGIVIGRKAAVRAVDRNRCKRWVREAFRGAQHHLVGLDIVVRLRPGLDPDSIGVLRAELTEALAAIARCRDSLSA